MGWTDLLTESEQTVVKHMRSADLIRLPADQQEFVAKQRRTIELLDLLDSIDPLKQRSDLPYRWGKNSGLLTNSEMYRITRFCIDALYF